MERQARNANAVVVITGRRLGQPPLLTEAPGLGAHDFSYTSKQSRRSATIIRTRSLI